MRTFNTFLNRWNTYYNYVELKKKTFKYNATPKYFPYLQA